MSDIISKIDIRFSSGNDVPVTRAHITDSEWEILRGEIYRLRAELDALRKQEPVAWMLEWTYDGDEQGRRLYDDERHCLLDAERDGGVCRPLYAAPVPPAAVAVIPDGFVLVPKNPTLEMERAACLNWSGYAQDSSDDFFPTKWEIVQVWDAMLAAEQAQGEGK